jgi:hypothetical protein
MTASNALSSEPGTFDNAVLTNSLNGVLRASWGVAASSRPIRRNKVLIATNQDNEDGFHGECKYAQNLKMAFGWFKVLKK